MDNVFGGESFSGENSDPIDQLHESVDTRETGNTGFQETRTETKSVETTDGPLGVDIGTSRIVEFHKEGVKYIKNSQLNAFFIIPTSNFTKNMLDQNNLLYHQVNGSIMVEGDGAASFANISNGEIRRPMSSGVLNPDEEHGPMIIEDLIKSLVKKPKSLGERLCFSIPSMPRGSNMNAIFHEKIIKDCFVSLGYMAKSINEGHSIVLSELEKDNYTGIGISCGAGLCNVCLSYLSVPILNFSITQAGDFIDISTANAVGELVNRVRVIKEESLNLIAEPKNRVDRALHIYYENMIIHLIQNLKEAMEESENMPRVNKEIPIVLSGGTAMVEGFRDKFDNILRESNFPLEISEVRMAEEPLCGTAKGAFMAACAEDPA